MKGCVGVWGRYQVVDYVGGSEEGVSEDGDVT